MESNYLSCLTGLVEGNQILLADIDDWGVYRIDWERNVCELMWALQGEEGKLFWCKDILHIGDSYYFLYRNCMRIKELNILTGCMSDYGYDKELGLNSELHYVFAFERNGKIIMLPGALDKEIWEFDICKKTFFKIGKLYEIVHFDLDNASQKRIFGYHFYDNKFWFAVCGTTMMGYISPETLAGENFMLDLDIMIEDIISPEKYMESQMLILKDQNANIYTFDGIQILKLNIPQCRDEDRIFNMFLYNDFYYAMTERFDSIKIYSKKGELNESISLPEQFEKMPEIRLCEIACVCYPLIQCEKCFYLPLSSNGMIELDLNSHEVKFIELKKDIIGVMFKRNSKKVLMEGLDIDLDKMLMYLKS